MLLDIIILVVTILAVVKSADWFLESAEKIGIYFRLPAFILGVVLVGFGTSLPELATSMAAVTSGVNDVTIANVVGSNIANVLLILGIATIALGTIKFDKNLIDLDIPLLVGVTALFSLMLVDGQLKAAEGVILLTAFAGYLIYSTSYKEDKAFHAGLVSLISALAKRSKSQLKRTDKLVTPATIFTLFSSVVLLGVASKFAVDSLLNIVERVDIGVSVLSFFALAVGTSLPELVVSIKALKKGQGDIVVGNIIGSCMFNIMLICGLTSIIKPQVVDAGLIAWFITGLGLSVVLIMASSISKRIHIWEGLIYVLLYATISINILQV